jgi:hypothetical protein
MPRKHTIVVALSLAFAAVVGTIALAKTVHLGQASAKPVSQTVVTKRTRQLDRFEASLRAALKKTPPAVPKLPPTPVVSTTPAAAPAPAVSAPVAAPAAAPAPPQRVVYVRPAPIIIHKHRAGGEHDSEGSDQSDGSGNGAIGVGGGND